MDWLEKLEIVPNSHVHGMIGVVERNLKSFNHFMYETVWEISIFSKQSRRWSDCEWLGKKMKLPTSLVHEVFGVFGEF